MPSTTMLNFCGQALQLGLYCLHQCRYSELGDGYLRMWVR